MRAKWYVGRSRKSGNYEAFSSIEQPTADTHGKDYVYVIGPYKTKRAALFVEKHGDGNPHCITISQAERLAKQFASQPK